MCEAARNYGTRRLALLDAERVGLFTVSVVVEVQKLVAPLCDDAERILQESDDNEESPNRWQISRIRVCQIDETQTSSASRS